MSIINNNNSEVAFFIFFMKPLGSYSESVAVIYWQCDNYNPK